MKCHDCNQEQLPTSRYCLRCWIRDSVRRTLGVKDKQQKEHLTDLLLVKLQDQNHQCVYTGKQLKAGVNLSLDHILPKSEFPELNLDLSNLVWVDLAVNVAKNKLLPSNFRQMCEDVVLFQSELLKGCE